MKPRSQDTILVTGLSTVLAVATGAASWFLLCTGKPLFTSAVRRQVQFAIVAPYDSALLTVDRGSVRYDATTGLLSFSVYFGRGTTRLSFSEQPTPGGLGTTPGLYDKLMVKLNTYMSIDSRLGVLSLAHPTELSGGQSALLSSHGSLVVIRPNATLGEADWRHIAAKLEVLP